MTRSFCVLGFVVLTVASLALIAQSQPSDSSKADGLSIARAYMKGMETGRLDELNKLFLPDGKSNILENASNEGSWEHYRDHHLKPEMEATSNFRVKVTDETVTRFDSTILVRQVGTFSMEVKEELRKYRMAVTYLIVDHAGKPKIAHIHWSSRPERKKP